MRRLHQEATEQLELMRTTLEASELALGTIKDALDEMAVDHWNAYLDVMHMITIHDESMANIVGKRGMKMRDSEGSEAGQQLFGNRPLLLLTVIALTRRHRRFCDIYSWRGNPLSEYLKESMTTEREHIAELMVMIQNSM
jgi:hypothetical protein